MEAGLVGRSGQDMEKVISTSTNNRGPERAADRIQNVEERSVAAPLDKLDVSNLTNKITDDML